MEKGKSRVVRASRQSVGEEILVSSNPVPVKDNNGTADRHTVQYILDILGPENSH